MTRSEAIAARPTAPIYPRWLCAMIEPTEDGRIQSEAVPCASAVTGAQAARWRDGESLS